MDEGVKINDKAGRPLGILLVAIYTAVSSVLYIMSGIADLFIIKAAEQVSHALTNAYISFGILGLIASYGLITMKKWSYNLAILAQILFVGLGLVIILLDKTGGDIFKPAFSVLITIWIVVYLFRPTVKVLYR